MKRLVGTATRQERQLVDFEFDRSPVRLKLCYSIADSSLFDLTDAQMRQKMLRRASVSVQEGALAPRELFHERGEKSLDGRRRGLDSALGVAVDGRPGDCFASAWIERFGYQMDIAATSCEGEVRQSNGKGSDRTEVRIRSNLGRRIRKFSLRDEGPKKVDVWGPAIKACVVCTSNLLDGITEF